MNTQPLLHKEKSGQDGRVRVCFVCTGNTCRSPMAAAVLNALGGDRYIATSAGLAASGGRDMSENAKAALARAGIEPPPHISRPLTEGDIEENDIIIGMTANHYMILMQAFPGELSRLESMARDVGDPYGGDLAVYERCLAEIIQALKERFAL